MPTLLAFVATMNYALWPDLVIKSTGAGIILAFNISKAAVVVLHARANTFGTSPSMKPNSPQSGE
jgi:hypothetical protein